MKLTSIDRIGMLYVRITPDALFVIKSVHTVSYLILGAMLEHESYTDPIYNASIQAEKPRARCFMMTNELVPHFVICMEYEVERRATGDEDYVTLPPDIPAEKGIRLMEIFWDLHRANNRGDSA